MQEVLNQSLNTGVAFVVGRVGNEVFADYMKKLIGEETGVDLPNEAAPLVSNLDEPRDLEQAQASFGQGIAMSPISITRALAALGNGGYLVDPHVVREIRYDLGHSRKVEPNKPKRIFKEETSEEISRMLVTVVDDVLGGGEVELKNHTIAAKTGTAQIAGSGGEYLEKATNHSFVGYAPADDPRFVIMVKLDRPSSAEYSASTSARVFGELAKYMLNYYEIPPDF